MARLRVSVGQQFAWAAPRRSRRRGHGWTRRTNNIQRVEHEENGPVARYLCNRRGNVGEYEYRIVWVSNRRTWVAQEMLGVDWAMDILVVDMWVDAGRVGSVLEWARAHGYNLVDA